MQNCSKFISSLTWAIAMNVKRKLIRSVVNISVKLWARCIYWPEGSKLVYCCSTLSPSPSSFIPVCSLQGTLDPIYVEFGTRISLSHIQTQTPFLDHRPDICRRIDLSKAGWTVFCIWLAWMFVSTDNSKHGADYLSPYRVQYPSSNQSLGNFREFLSSHVGSLCFCSTLQG